MDVKIAYLYYDLMNLYGDAGNVSVLKYQLDKIGINAEIYKFSVEDDVDIDLYDVFIIGCGTEYNQSKVAHDFIQYKQKIKNAIENGKVFLCTGNAIELFGKSITDSYGSINNALGIFEYDVRHSKQRIVDDLIFNFPEIKKPIIGFQNQEGIIENYDLNLFEVLRGFGGNSSITKEGIHYKNFFGTYVIGPILARNPYFLEYFIKCIIESKDKDYEIKNLDLELDKKAFNEIMERHYPKYL